MLVIQDWAGFKTPIDHPRVISARNSVLDTLGKPAVIYGCRGVCDATYLNKYNTPSVLFGPGSVSWSVHGNDEYTTIDNLVNAAKVYASMMIDWCK